MEDVPLANKPYRGDQKMPPKEPVDLTGEKLKSVKEEHSVVVVDFWAEWCAPCKTMEPIMDSLAEKLGDEVFFGKVNVDEERETASEFQISSIPAILFFKDGEVKDQVIGARPKEDLEEKISGLID